MSTLERCIPTLRVADADASARYFTDRLGFKRDFEHRFEPGLPLFVAVSRDGVVLHLSEHTGDGPFGIHAYVYVDEAESLFKELEASGARFAFSLTQQPYGTLEFGVSDLDGNLLRFGQRLA